MTGNGRNSRKKILHMAVSFGGLYFMMKAVAKKMTEGEELNEDNPYLYGRGASSAVPDEMPTAYERMIKPLFDRVLSFAGLVILSPLFAVISIAIFIDDPGPVLFTQKRAGKGNGFFCLHKFRSMKMSTPHDVPTHQLKNPEQYITRVGRILRKTSLDELPQIWDIFRGKMSIIGPRPALWNQEDLLAEREKYGANGVMPGLTGMAQINGRDELEIEDKAKLDGVYVKILRSGNVKGFVQDMKCFVKTVGSVVKSDGVVEGGTGAQNKQNVQERKLAGDEYRFCNSVKKMSIENISPADAGFEDYGYRKTFHIDTSSANHKRVLVTGAGSYIGDSFRQYAAKHYEKNFTIDTLDMRDSTWQTKDFSPYDAVFHVAGIAHADVGCVDEAAKARYYAVNTDLAIGTAEKAKKEGVRQFILMSSMIIYGDSAPYGKEKVIDEHTLPAPSNFYGDSKWKADQGVRKLGDGKFHVAVLRPPMIYGKGSKGNYSKLSKWAKKLPVFPDVKNVRSMLHIDNLCEFICLLILFGKGGIYFPQNTEYAKTTEMVKEIAQVAGNSVKLIKLLNPVVFLGSISPGSIKTLVNKVFGNAVYAQKISHYEGLEYHVTDFADSIWRTEREDKMEQLLKSDSRSGSQKRALMLASVASMIDLFNADNINILIDMGYKVDVAANFTFGSITSQEQVKAYKKELHARGIGVYDIPIPRDLSKVDEMRKSYQMIKKIIHKNHYDIVHCHSPIGGVLCRFACRSVRKYGTKVIYTAHGFHFFNGAGCKAWMFFYPIENWLSRFTDILITINEEDYKLAKRKFHAKKTVYIPGIGIDIRKFRDVKVKWDEKRKELGISDHDIMLLSVGELNENKNHEIVIRALGDIGRMNPGFSCNLHYFIAGKGELRKKLDVLARQLNINLHLLGFREDVAELLKAADIYILPSKREGLNVSLMEAMASSMLCIASEIRGNRDLIKNKNCLFDPCKSESVVRCLKDKLVGECKDEIDLKNKRLIQENDKVIQKFDLRFVNKRMISIYRVCEER